MTMRVGIVHATTMALVPIQEAFREVEPDLELVNIMDTGLLNLLRQEGQITPVVQRRLVRLIELAEESDVGCILLTGSIFNPLANQLQPLFNAKIFRSDEAMLDKALSYASLCLATTEPKSAEALAGYIKEKKPSVRVESVANPEAFQLLLKGKQEAHDKLAIEMLENIKFDVDAIVLTQYSLAHLVGRARTSIPILSGPQAAARRCVQYLERI